MAAVLVTEFMDGSALAFLKNRVQVDYAPHICENHQEIMRRIAGVHALIVRNRTQVTADIFACANHLKVVGRLGVGLDNIDLEAAEHANVEVVRLNTHFARLNAD